VPANTQYVTNRTPLLPSALVCLPPGAVRPEGWPAKMLRLQADGFHGRLGELSQFLRKDGNAGLVLALTPRSGPVAGGVDERTC
jgi:hypothetical protein